MSLARVALALVIALAMAVQPLGPVHATGSGTADVAVFEPAPDCGDHHEQPAGHPFRAAPICAETAGCAAICLDLPAALNGTAAYESISPIRAPAIFDSGITLRTGDAPFRPPRD